MTDKTGRKEFRIEGTVEVRIAPELPRQVWTDGSIRVVETQAGKPFVELRSKDALGGDRWEEIGQSWADSVDKRLARALTTALDDKRRLHDELIAAARGQEAEEKRGAEIRLLFERQAENLADAQKKIEELRGRDRDARQERVVAFGRDAFGAAQMSSVPHRALKLLEEVLELYQASGGPRQMALDLVDFVFARPVGDPVQELGGVGVTLLAMAAALGGSADEAERVEAERLMLKGPAYFRNRNDAKIAAGFDLTREAVRREAEIETPSEPRVACRFLDHDALGDPKQVDAAEHDEGCPWLAGWLRRRADEGKALREELAKGETLVWLSVDDEGSVLRAVKPEGESYRLDRYEPSTPNELGRWREVSLDAPSLDELVRGCKDIEIGDETTIALIRETARRMREALDRQEGKAAKEKADVERPKTIDRPSSLAEEIRASAARAGYAVESVAKETDR